MALHVNDPTLRTRGNHTTQRDATLSYLLAPMGKPDGFLDLAGLSTEFTSMTAADLDAWLSSVPDGARVASS